MKNCKVKTLLAAAGILTVECVICRYLLYDLHHTMDIFWLCLFFDLAVSCAASLNGWDRIVVSTVAGYAISFCLGLLFNVDWMDVHGTRCNSFWICFVCGNIAFVCIGVLWELIARWKGKKG